MEIFPFLKDLKEANPGIDDNIIKKHLQNLNENYYSYFSREEINKHIKAVSDLSNSNVEVIYTLSGSDKINCTVIACDYPGVFSLITGILSGFGLKINSGRIFTYQKESVKVKTEKPGMQKIRRQTLKTPEKKRIIIDSFNGILSSTIFSSVWVSEIESQFNEVFGLLNSRDNESISKAKEKVNELVAKKLIDFHENLSIFYPVKIEVDDNYKAFNRIKIYSEDTPFFLYTLSSALSMQNIQIEHVNIQTIDSQVIDEFDIVDLNDKKIKNPDIIDRIKLSVLLTKQFTYFIGTAPDPYAALSRFEYLIGKIISRPEKGDWMTMFSNPHLLRDLAKLLGTSDFLWEDFIRLQYETILPLLESNDMQKNILDRFKTIPERLREVFKNAETREEERRSLNEFKDREIFLIDLDHILNPETDFRILSERLTILADTVIKAAVKSSYKHLTEIYGIPGTVAGLETKYSVLGLGKYGGAALGYASDIELLFIYSDEGRTDGKRSIKNSEFYDLLVKEIINCIKAKKEGIFDLDLRLRPYGNNGPLACSLNSFCRYYGAGGDAYSFERLALVRMRPVCEDRKFGEQLKRLRNEYIYSTNSIDIKEIHALRKKQFLEKTEHGKLNAKFSPGALVDLEYTVQILQIIYGKKYHSLRTSSIHRALNALTEHGILDKEERELLVEAYDFLRNLINGLRMLRGSAKDLFLPPADSKEYGHLARRMGYINKGDLSAAKQLHIEFETRTAMVRTFIEKHFGRDILPGDKPGNIADLILSKDISDSQSNKILIDYGFTNPVRAYVNLKRLASEGEAQKIFVRLAVLATDILLHKVNPDMALNNWERFVSILPDPVQHYRNMLSQPMKLEIILSIFSTSQFLSDICIRNPGFLERVVIPEHLYKSLNREDIEKELNELYSASSTHENWLNAIRRLKQREILSIGIRDICLEMNFNDIVRDLSGLAEAILQVTSEVNCGLLKEKKNQIELSKVENSYSIMAFGKLGGNELNYSSDLDLLLIYEAEGDLEIENESIYSKIIEKVSSDLSLHTEEGYAYRIDLRLRPYGSSGFLAFSVNKLMNYYKYDASLWELQALLKLRPVAGNLSIGYKFLNKVKTIFLNRIPEKEIIKSIEKLRNVSSIASSRSFLSGIDIKNGEGGIRDIEFLVQGLQLIYLPSYPELLQSNTLEALAGLDKSGIVDHDTVEQLNKDYVFMRQVEHYLQLYEDRQVHSIPKDSVQLKALAKRMLGADATCAGFMDQLQEHQKRIRRFYIGYLLEKEK